MSQTRPLLSLSQSPVSRLTRVGRVVVSVGLTSRRRSPTVGLPSTVEDWTRTVRRRKGCGRGRVCRFEVNLLRSAGLGL